MADQAASLREYLARRLFKVGSSAQPSQGWDMKPMLVCEAMADECLKQMKWNFWDGYGYSAVAHDPKKIGISLAPENWKPEEES